jgi:hypothetical protein
LVEVPAQPVKVPRTPARARREKSLGRWFFIEVMD